VNLISAPDESARIQTRAIGGSLGVRRGAMVLRSGMLADAYLLLGWRNDAVTRANSGDHSEVCLDGHVTWLARVLADPERELLIAEVDRVAVGTVRLDRLGAEYVLSWTIAPQWRGQGLGGAMVRLAVERARGRRLRAEIAPSNEASLAIARALGFRMSRTIGQMTVWHRFEPAVIERRVYHAG
jgi:RimJ/RimL family protein N-acetyltransferase